MQKKVWGKEKKWEQASVETFRSVYSEYSTYEYHTFYIQELVRRRKRLKKGKK